MALVSAISTISQKIVPKDVVIPYLNIPENKPLFYDILIKNVSNNNGNLQTEDIGICYEEVLSHDLIKFKPVVKFVGDMRKYFGHRIIDAKGAKVLSKSFSQIEISSKVDVIIIKNEQISLLVENNSI